MMFKYLYRLLALSIDMNKADFYRIWEEEAKTFTEQQTFLDFDGKMEKLKQNMINELGNDEALELYGDFVGLMYDLKDGVYKDNIDIMEKILPIAYGVKTDFTRFKGESKKQYAIIEADFKEYKVSYKIHFFIEHIYNRISAGGDKEFNSIDMIAELVWGSTDRGLPESTKTIRDIFTEKHKDLQEMLFTDLGDGNYRCDIELWNNMYTYDWKQQLNEVDDAVVNYQKKVLAKKELIKA